MFIGGTPFLRYIHYIQLVPEFTSFVQTGYDNRIFFCVSGEYKITAGGAEYELKENSLLFVPSGIPYRLHRPENEVLLIGINFDFSSDFAHLDAPIAPAIREENFRRENVLEKNTAEVPLIFHNRNALLPLINEMLDEYMTKLLFFKEKNSALLSQLLVSLERFRVTGLNPKSHADAVINYIQANYKRRISNAEIGRELNFHPNYLNRLMLRHTGKSLHRYLLSVRLTKALDLLQTTSMPICDIAAETGFADTAQFSKFFKAQTGSAPSAFR